VQRKGGERKEKRKKRRETERNEGNKKVAGRREGGGAVNGSFSEPVEAFCEFNLALYYPEQRI